jgi:hypothetical protein
MTTIPDWLFDRPDLAFEEKWLYVCLMILCESIPDQQYQTYAATIEEIKQDTHATRPIDPLSLLVLADKRLIRLTQTGEEYAIAIVRREKQEEKDKPPRSIETKDAEAQARQDWSNDE